jgi:hypothetical protein
MGFYQNQIVPLHLTFSRRDDTAAISGKISLPHRQIDQRANGPRLSAVSYANESQHTSGLPGGGQDHAARAGVTGTIKLKLKSPI